MLNSLEVLGGGEDTPPQMVDSVRGLPGLGSFSIEQGSSGLLVAQSALEGESVAAAAVEGSFKKNRFTMRGI